MRREKLLGFDVWALVVLTVSFVPDGSRLYAALGVLAGVVLLVRFVGGMPESDLCRFHSWLGVMMICSVVLPVFRVTSWYSMVVPFVFTLMYFSKKPRDPFLLLLIWGICIGLVSGGAGGASGWRGWLVELLGLTPEQADMLVVDIRKGMHFFYYGILAFLTLRYAVHVRHRAPILTAGLLSMGLATYDETRQLFTPFRTGSLRDWLVDLCGVAFFVTLWWVVQRRQAQGLASRSQ